MKEKFSFNFLLSRLIITLNIVILIVSIVFLIIFNKNIAAYALPPAIKDLIPRINIIILLIGTSLVIANIILLLINILYSVNQYFKVLEKIDFEDINSSLNILNTVNNIDEIGNLGEKITKLLKIYINYASLYKKRIFFSKLKGKIILEQISTAAITLDQLADGSKGFGVNHMNKKGRTLLNIDQTSSVIGKSFFSMLSNNSQKLFLEIITQKISHTSLESLNTSKTKLEPVNATLEFLDFSHQLNKDKTTVSEKFPIISCEVSIFPFIFQFPDDYKYSNSVQFPSNQNIALDSLLILLWKSDPSNEKLPVADNKSVEKIIES